MAPIRLAELLGRLSLPFDVAADSPPGRAVRSTVLAVELGKRAGASNEELRVTYWLTLRGYLGGTSFVRDLIERVETGPLVAVVSERFQRIGRLVEVAHRREGRAAALGALRRLSEGEIDPSLAKVFLEEHGALFEAIEDPRIFERFLELEPAPLEWADEPRVDSVARALALFTDLTNPIFLVHSTGVAALAERAAGQLGLASDETRTLRMAALLHDLGRVSVPNSIWAHPGPLDWSAWERVRLHPYYTGRVLDEIGAFAEVADVATAAHERMDGSGYPRRRSARTLPVAARVLAAAHMAFAMSEDRPHRPALCSDAIARELVAEAAVGRLDPKAVDAVLASLGVPDRAARCRSHGLSERELEVSQLLARGKSDKEIGAMLSISPRTVQVHVARILDKLGVRSRAGAAIWFIEHDLAS